MGFSKLIRKGALAILLGLSPFMQESYSQEPRLVLYTPEMNFQQLQLRYKQALEEALIKAEEQKNTGEIQAIKFELKRLPIINVKKQVICPEKEIGYTNEGQSSKPPFLIEKDKTNKSLKIIFQSSKIPTLTNQGLYLNLIISNYKYAGTKDTIEVYCDGKKVGEQEGVKEDSLVSIALDTRRLPKTPNLELTVQINGSDLLILGNTNSSRVSYLEVVQ